MKTVHREQPSEAQAELIASIFEITQSVTNAPVRAEFSLINPSPMSTSPMEEFISENLEGGRMIALPSGGEIAVRHARLVEAGLPVLSGIHTTNHLLLLQVPHNTRPLTGFLHAIRRNPADYDEVFAEIGVACANLARQDIGLPEATEDYPLLRQFGLIPDSDAESGGKVCLLPPYSLTALDKDQVLRALGQELIDTDIVLPDQADYITDLVAATWSEHEGTQYV